MLAWKQLFIQRVRNSSLVERQSSDRAWIINGYQAYHRSSGHVSVVGEHSIQRRSSVVRHCGAYGKANVGISNDNAGEKPAHRKTKVS